MRRAERSRELRTYLWCLGRMAELNAVPEEQCCSMFPPSFEETEADKDETKRERERERERERRKRREKRDNKSFSCTNHRETFRRTISQMLLATRAHHRGRDDIPWLDEFTSFTVPHNFLFARDLSPTYARFSPKRQLPPLFSRKRVS